MLEKNEDGVGKFEIIAPLMQGDLDAGEKRRRRSEIMEKHGISERTLRRYLALYRKHGFDGLLPKSKKTGFKAIPAEILKAAVEIKRELPERSVRRIITILEKEGYVEPGKISRSTLSHNLLKLGCTRKELQRDIITGKIAARRFVRCGRNTLWQSDIKYGPYIPDDKGEKKRTYLASFIDDATRVVTHSEFYDNQRVPILEDCFRKAMIKFGKPDEIYVDNGSQYTSRWFRVACARLKIRYMNAKPYSPESKGKIERFNRTVNEFMQEISLERPGTLKELNHKYRIWLEEGYQNQAHSGIKGDTPIKRFQTDAKNIRPASIEECYDAFLHEETRKVDKTGCVSLAGIVYEAGVELIGKKVDLRFDPFDLSRVEIWHGGRKRHVVEPLIIGEFCGNALKTNDRIEVGKSRLLDVYAIDNKKRCKQKMSIISFADKKEADNV